MDSTTQNLNKKINDLTESINQTLNVHDDRVNRLEESLRYVLKESDNRINELGENVNHWAEKLKRIESKKAEKEEILKLTEHKAGKDEIQKIQEKIEEILLNIHDNKLNRWLA